MPGRRPRNWRIACRAPPTMGSVLPERDTIGCGIAFAASARMTDLDRVLDVLLHDLRSPLGVAGGYLRLLREQRLSTPEDSERAIVKAQDALRMMTALCADAAEWLKPPPANTPSRVLVDHFVAQVVADAHALSVAIEAAEDAGSAATVVLDMDHVARAVATLLAVVSRQGACRCTVHRNGRVLWFSVAAPERRGHDGTRAFDPWSYPGLSAALACRTITLAGGRCNGGADAAVALRVEFDLTTSDPATPAPGVTGR